MYQFPLEQLQPQISGLPIDDLLSRQFEAEIGGSVEVKSIANAKEYNEPEVEKANKCCNHLIDRWKKQLRITLEEKITKRFVHWKKHLSGKDAMLPTSAFIDMIPLGKRIIRINCQCYFVQMFMQSSTFLKSVN